MIPRGHDLQVENHWEPAPVSVLGAQLCSKTLASLAQGKSVCWLPIDPSTPIPNKKRYVQRAPQFFLQISPMQY